jgi:hypothetical protein
MMLVPNALRIGSGIGFLAGGGTGQLEGTCPPRALGGWGRIRIHSWLLRQYRGLARKGLNIFLRECLYTVYLRGALFARVG